MSHLLCIRPVTLRALSENAGRSAFTVHPLVPMKTLRILLLTCALAFAGARGFAQTTVAITATDASAAETPAGQPANPGNIRITRTGSTASQLIVYVKSVTGLAVGGVDYSFGISFGSFITIPAGTTTVDIPVNVLDDFLTEGAEDIRLRLDTETPSGTPAAYTISGSDRATVNIADNEDPLAPLRAILSVAAVDATATETPGGTDPAVFRITRTNNLAPAINVLFALGGTAAADVDYTSPPATITIPAGVASVDVTITPIDDPFIESNETVTFALLPTDVPGTPPPAEAYALDLVSTASATLVSEDQPPAPVVTISKPGPNAAAAIDRPFTVNFTASVSDGYIVSYAVRGGSAVASGATNLPTSTPAGTPYSGTANITFTAPNMIAQVSVQVTASNGRTVSSAAVPVYTFRMPPQPPEPPVLPIINIYALDANGVEVASGSPDTASFRVTHDFPATATVGFLYAMGGTARPGIDYTVSFGGVASTSFLGNWFAFPAGTTEAIIDIIPVDDFLIENSETVTMSLYTPPFIGFNEGGPQGFDPGTFGFYYGPNWTATVNIASNDTTPPPFPLITIAVSDASGMETPDGSDPVSFTIARTGGTNDAPLAVRYAFTIPPRTSIYITPPPAMATNGVDFPTLSGIATIPAGASSVDLVVVPTFDLIAEPAELLRLALQPSAVAWPASGGYVLDENLTATATIRDAVLPTGTPVVTIAASDSRAYELDTAPSRTASFVVRRTGSITNAINVAYTIAGTATNGVDYVSLPGVVTIAAGSTATQILVTPIDDFIEENVESVSLTLQAPPASAQPPYTLGLGSTNLTAGIAIRDIYIPALNRYQRALRHRFPNRYVAISRPLEPNAPTAPPPPGDAPLGFKVEASTNLVNWEEIGTIGVDEDSDDFVDVEAGNHESRFYRFSPIMP